MRGDGVILTPLILSRLPQDARLEWPREGRVSDLDWPLTFLDREISIIQGLRQSWWLAWISVRKLAKFFVVC